ncbi:MAG: hypothetical protein H7210_09075, partial [Pyrinomonadaceae bacterium]|nr:hypothetical protein [Phycisphaerales bacterium]
MRMSCLLAAVVICAGAVPALGQIDGLHNGGFEIVGGPPSPTGPQGWRGFNFARLRTIDDGLGPVLVHSGVNSIELASGSGPTNNFCAFT